ncbi:MAG: GTPase [Synechococcales cyanobacterium CRU_2_2]|nr:GTPase [Synechococcales cyanobacterium CRU_2_2]
MAAISRDELLALIDLAQAENREELDLSGMELTELPPEIGKLTKLRKLVLGKVTEWNWVGGKLVPTLVTNQLTAWPEELQLLTHLRELDLSGNPLGCCPDWIGKFGLLEQLQLTSIGLSEIPDSLAALTNLTELWLHSNQITSIPDSFAALTNLTCLDLEKNQITDIPVVLQALPKLAQLDLRGNPLSVPKDVLDSDANTRDDSDRPAAKPILDYYFTTRDPNEITHLYEAKLLIVGEGESGKTSLANKLITPESPLQPQPTTHGIDILPWDYTHQDHPYRIHIWDFGGQEIYHATHQFFLTEQSLYLLVADSRKEDTDHPYWLNIIRLLSNNSPVLLVRNEKDDRPCNLNLRELRTEFDALSIPKPINLADDRGLPDLRKAIQRQLEDLLGPGIRFPNKWFNLRNSLENDKRNHITLHDYQATCRRHNITDEREMLTLSNHLHQLGTCLHFQHDPILKHTLILKPNWGTAAVYKVLDNDRVTQNLGQFSTADLSDIWSDRQYTNLQDELLHLMRQFKVCYEIPHRSGHYIAPHLLSTDSPDYPNCWRSPTTIALRYEYEGIMPKGLLSRFIVEMHEDIENVSCPDQALVWRTGVVLSRANNRAEILETQIRNEIQIRVSGPSPRDLLTVIHHEFTKIHNSFGDQLHYDTRIPCNCSCCKPSKKPNSFTLKLIDTYIERGQPTIQCNESAENVQVRNLRDGVIAPDRFDKPGYEAFMGYDRPDFGPDLTSVRSRKPSSPKSRKPKAEKSVQPIVNVTVHANNQQEQTMTNDKIWNGDRIDGDKVMGDKVAGNKMQINTVQGDAIAGNKIVNAQNLTEAAKDIKALLNQISATDTTKNPMLIAVKAIAEIENNPTLKTRILNAGKEAGFAALDAAVDHPAIKIVTAALKGAIDA